MKKMHTEKIVTATGGHAATQHGQLSDNTISNTATAGDGHVDRHKHGIDTIF